MAPKHAIPFISEPARPPKPCPWPVGWWCWSSGDVTSQRIPDSLCHQALPAVGAVRSSCCSFFFFFLLHPGSHRGESEKERKKEKKSIRKNARQIRPPRSFPPFSAKLSFMSPVFGLYATHSCWWNQSKNTKLPKNLF